jgi:hypothetical protein
MKKLLAVAVLLTALFATQNANGQENIIVNNYNNNELLAYNSSGTNGELSDIYTIYSGYNSTGSISYSFSTENDGYTYLKYKNTTNKYYIIKYKCTCNGNNYSNYVEAKPNVTTSVQVGNCSNYSVTSCEPIDD